MTFIKRLNDWQADEAGAVTVDWVVLTAAIVVLSLAVGIAVRTGTIEVGETIEQRLIAAAAD